MSQNEEQGNLQETALHLVLDDLDEGERAALEERTAREPALAAEVARLRRTLDLLPRATAKTPPATLRDRIVHGTRVPERAAARSRRPSGGTLAAIAASLVATLLAWDGFRLRREFQMQRDVSAMLLEPNVVLSFQLAGTGDGSGAFGAVALDLDDEKGAISIQGLPAIAADQIYELWAEVAGESVPCGRFKVDETGRALTQFAVPVDSYTAPVERLFVTVEPRSGTDRPTGPIVMESV